MSERIETVVIGGGQAGLAMSYHLTRQGRPHVVLERGRIGERWRSACWDSLLLDLPNWLVALPGQAYDGDDPEGFLPKDDYVAFLERYAATYRLPVRTGVRVTALAPRGAADGYLISTVGGAIEAANVVVAAGPHQQPKRLPLGAALPGDLVQLHSSEYRTPAQLPPGAVLVVGAGASGCQICEELAEHGRRVYLSLSRCVRTRRHYRGRTSAWWAVRRGVPERLAEHSPPRHPRFGCFRQMTGRHGGHDLDYRAFAAAGVVLLGRLAAVRDGRLLLADDLAETIALWDESLADWQRQIDEFIDRTGLAAPPDDRSGEPEPLPRDAVEPITELDLKAAGIASVIWATGLTPDFSWVHAPVFDAAGDLVHRRGVTALPGLYFLGLERLHKVKSAGIFGVGEDAAHLAATIAGLASEAGLRRRDGA